MLNRISDARAKEEVGGATQPDKTSIAAVIDRMIAATQAEGGPEIEFYDDIPIDELPSELRTVMLSIVKELLSNACRHSKSKNVLVGLGQDDDRVCIQVQDWGVGFVPEMVQPHKRGLKGLRQLVEWQGGTMNVDSRPGVGTCVVVEIPLVRETGTNDPASERKPT